MIVHQNETSTFFNPFGGNILHSEIDESTIKKIKDFINEFEYTSKQREQINKSPKHKVIQTNSTYDLENNTIANGEIRMVDMFIQRDMCDGIIEDTIYNLVQKYNQFSLNEYKKIANNNLGFLLSDKRNVNDYVKKLESSYDEMEFSINDVWYVRMKRGDYHLLHNHNEPTLSNFYSGAIYIDVPSLSFPQGSLVLMSGIENNHFTKNHFTFTPKSGTGLLWPSNLNHFVYPFTVDSERLMLSFNVKVT